MKITVLDGYALNPGDLLWDGFGELGELIVYDRTSADELLQKAKDSEVLITNKTVLDADTINSLPELKYIGVLATGYNVVDTEAAKEHGIVVTNIPAYSTMSVAQRVFALILAVTDRVEHYAIANKKGAWTSSKDFAWWDTPLMELAGKKFGVVGLGNIGMAVTKIANAFGMDVLAYTSKDSGLLPSAVKKVTFDDLLMESDIISLHCPLTNLTQGLINNEAIQKMKTGVILINTGRGPLIDEVAVSDALRSGKIGAFGADVLSTEPPKSDNPLLSAPNSYITPHTAWATKEARERLMQIAEENLRAFINESPKNVVNPW